MKIVKQKGESDCVLASLAMATGRPYSSLFKPAFRKKIEAANGCYDSTLKEALKMAGFVEGKNALSIWTQDLDKKYVQALIWKRKALIQVVSLNYAGGEHMIYWDGKELFDPSNKQVYKFVENLRPTYVWLLGDANV
jgi:ABC-type bacteriocin/lantibiotic exporter with double-glycine peptidase domain